VVVLEEQAKAGEVTAIVTGALPLTEEEQKVVGNGPAARPSASDRVRDRSGYPWRASGVRAGNRPIGGSVVGQSERLQESLD
jgi:hypothetical protein